MRKFILPVFAVATVAILAGAVVAEGPGREVVADPIHGPVTIRADMPKLTEQGLRGPAPGGPADVQAQVFGELATIHEVGR